MIGVRPERKTKRRILAAACLATALGLGGPALWMQMRQSVEAFDLVAAKRGSVIVVDQTGNLLRAYTTEEGRWRLPAAQGDIDPRFITMLLAYEDQHFRQHHGVDYAALGRAAFQWARSGHIVSGGSTLTMQTVRLLNRVKTQASESDDDSPPQKEERSLSIKARQVMQALALEERLGKKEILDLYFMLAPYGGNLEGIRAASLAYFGKEPKRLSVGEAALLVALPQSPETRRPDRFPQAAQKARDAVLARCLKAGVLSAADVVAARHEAVPTQKKAFPAFAPQASDNARKLMPQASIIETNLSLKLQASLETLAHDEAGRLGQKLSAGILVVENRTGALLASVGTADYFSQERAGAVDMTQALRSPGSALKPVIYALAFENGIAHPETILDDRPSRYGLYAPQNFDLTYQGTVTARRALQLSLNLPAIELLSEVGPARFIARLRNAGANIALSSDAAPGLAVGLGGLGITLTDLARIYTGFARGGSVPVLQLLKKPLAQEPPDRDLPHIAEPVASWYVADILRGAPPPLNAPAGRIAYKTGTSYGFRDAFAIGFDKTYTVAVWLGRPDNGAVPGLIGRQAAAPVLFETFARLNDDYAFPQAPKNALIATTATLPPPLRHLRKDVPKTFASMLTAPLKIVYPPDGARVELGLGAADHADAKALALKAQGGVPPLTWLVNGAPVGTPDLRHESSWSADGAGFARISIIDAKGASDSVLVRLD